MKPILSVKIIDGDTGIELDKVDRLIEPTKLGYKVVGDMLYRIYRWNFAYSMADDYALKLEEKMEEKNDSNNTI